MYAGEREALASWHRPDHGRQFLLDAEGRCPSRTYDLIKGEVMRTNSDMVKWSRHFSAREGDFVRSFPSLTMITCRSGEREALDKGAKFIASLIAKHGRIADVLHQLWPEWKNPEGTGKKSIPLPPEDVLGEVIQDDDEAERVGREIASVRGAKAALQRG